jgi:hypothetical protein
LGFFSSLQGSAPSLALALESVLMQSTIRIATRGSPLALRQAEREMEAAE